jgi:hypothetical protein
MPLLSLETIVSLPRRRLAMTCSLMAQCVRLGSAVSRIWLEREVANQPDALHSEGTEPVGGRAGRSPETADNGVGIHRSLNGLRVAALSDGRENEVEGVGAGRLQDQVRRQVEGASTGAPSGNRDNAVADGLRQRLHAAVQHNTEVATEIRMASQDIGAACGYRVTHRHHASCLVGHDGPQKHSASGHGGRGRAGTVLHLGLRVQASR